MHSRHHQRKAGPSFFLGLVIVGIGMVLLLERFGYLAANDIFDYWPLILVLIGANKIISAGDHGGRIFGGLMVLVGGGLLLDQMGVLVLEWSLILPLGLIALGVSLILRTRWRAKPNESASTAVDTLNGWAAFGGSRVVNNSSSFQGGEVLAVFGGYEVDLSEAKIQGEVVLNAYAFFGGVKIRVPQGWNVVCNGIPILGGYEDKTLARQRELAPDDQILLIKGIAMFGGVEIHH